MWNIITLPLSTIQRLIFCAGLALSLTGLLFVPIAAAQGNDARQLTVVAPVLNVRSGPGLAYPAFDALKQGDQAAVLNYNAASDWWQIQLPSGSTGWVSGGAAYVSVTPGWSTTITVTSTVPISTYLKSPGIIVFQTVSGGPIYAINADGSNLHYLTTGMDPALSPDGQWVAFTRWDSPQSGTLGSVWLIKVDGSGERQIHENVFQPRSPTWSPDGSHIIISMAYGAHLQPEYTCTSRRPKGLHGLTQITRGKTKFYCYILQPKPDWGMRQIDITTGQFEDLNHDTWSTSPTWDPANPSRVVYDGARSLVSLDLAQQTVSVLTADAQNYSPVFSPDGRKIAVGYQQDDHWEVHVMNADGSGDIRLTQTSYQIWVEQELRGEQPHSYNNAAPTWSPDSSQIAFLTDRTGQWEIWVMNADGSNQRPMFPQETLTGISLQYDGMDERVLSWR